MGWLDGWPFKTREQTERETKDFQTRVFPFGPEQKEAAMAVLQQGVGGKVKAEEKLFAFICTKDVFLQNGGELEDGLPAAKATLEKQKWIPPEGRAFILAFVRMESRAPSLEGYPTADDVRQAMAREAE